MIGRLRHAVLIAAVLGSASPGAVAADLGRLFFTPEQRAALDARRKARIPDKPAAVVPASPTTRLDGYVKRSRGPSTVWLNGQSVGDGNQPDSPRIPRTGNGRVEVPLGEGGARKGMKPGEVVDRGSGEVRDLIGDGEIRIRRQP